MRWHVVSMVAALSLLAACGGAADEPTGGFIDEGEPGGGSGPALWDFPGDGSLAARIAVSDAVVVAEVVEIIAVDYGGPATGTPPADMPAEIVETTWNRGRPYTTYGVAVEQWLKGDGPAETTITDMGAMTADGPFYVDGTFLLEEGRKYLTTLAVTVEAQPGEGEYTR